MSKFLSKISVCTAALIACGVVSAKPHESSMYIDAGIGTLYQSVSIFDQHYHYFGSVGANANIGYLFGRYFGTEIGYTNYSINRHGLNNVDFAIKGVLPFTVGSSDLSVFMKLGPAYLFAGGEDAVLPFAGIGGSYGITPNLDATLQFQGTTDGFFSMGLLSAGVTYYFS